MPRRVVRRAVVVGTVVALTAAAGGLAFATMGTAPSSRYRTAVVTTGDVQQQLALVGTANIVDKQIARLGVSGTVSSVKVAIGDVVKKGQVLATLSTTELDAAVTKAEADLATARANLETAQNASSTQSSSSSSSTGTTAGGSAGAGSASSTAGASALLQAATRVLQAAQATCSTGGAPSVTPTLTASPRVPAASPTTTSTPEPSSSPATKATTTSSTSTASQACLTALRSALSLQQQALTVLRSTQTTASPTSTGNGAGTASNGSGASASASDLTTLKAKVRAAETALEQARAQRQHATVTAPAAGTVASIPFAVGDTVTSGEGITLLGAGAVDVTVQVPAASLKDVKRGAAATVRPDAASSPVPGKVSAIMLLPTTSSSGSTTYATTVHVADPGKVRFTDGGAANVLITIKTVKNVVVVPNSALSDGFVTVLADGVTRRTQATTGAVGALVTQVLKGVVAGDEVVLADLSQSVPANSTNSTRLPFGGGSFPGGQFPAGAPPANFRPGG